MVTRSFTLPLLAVIVTSLLRAGTAEEKSASEFSPDARLGPDRARMTFVHALVGAGPLDLTGDGKTIRRNIHYGRSMKAKSLHAEAYSLDVAPAKVGLPLIDNYTADLLGGHDYTFLAYGDTGSTSPTQALLIDLPGALIPKTDVQVLFTNATLDAQPAELLVDDVALYSNVVPGSYQGPQSINSGKHRLEVRVNGHSVLSTNAKNIKGGETLNLVLHGTALEKDGSSLHLLYSRTKSR